MGMNIPDKDIDVTKLVEFYDNDGESLPLIKCVCGAEYVPWGNILSIYRDLAKVCPKCGRKFYFTNEIKVYEVKE